MSAEIPMVCFNKYHLHHSKNPDKTGLLREHRKKENIP